MNNFGAIPSNSGLSNPFGAIGCERARARTISCSNSSGTSTTVPIRCFRCGSSLSTLRCFECNALLCYDCSHKFTSECQLREHMLLPIFQQVPIGVEPNSVNDKNIVICESHSDPVNFFCRRCNSLICQKCSLNVHNGHDCVDINGTVDTWRTDVMKLILDTKTGTKVIKDAIDRAMAMLEDFEIEYMEAHTQIRRVMYCYAQAFEDCKNEIFNSIEEIRRSKKNELFNYISTLNAMLASLADINQKLVRCMDSRGLDLFMVKEYGRCKVDHILNVFWNMSINDNMPSYCNLINQLKRQYNVQSIAASPGLSLMKSVSTLTSL